MLRFSTRQEKEVSVISLSMCIFISWFQNLKKKSKIRLADIKLTSASLLSNIIGICLTQYPTKRKMVYLCATRSTICCIRNTWAFIIENVPMEKQRHFIVIQPVILINICVIRTFRESYPRTEVVLTLWNFIDRFSLETEYRTSRSLQKQEKLLVLSFWARANTRSRDAFIEKYAVKSLKGCRFGMILYHLRAELIKTVKAISWWHFNVLKLAPTPFNRTSP